MLSFNISVLQMICHVMHYLTWQILCCQKKKNLANTIILSPRGSSECKMRHLSSKSLVGKM